MADALQSVKVRLNFAPREPEGSLANGLCPQAAVERFILDPKNHDLLTIAKAARNGAVYGTKVRFPHALVYEPP
jgi:hypothetical protein